jgi:hypothetical protein
MLLEQDITEAAIRICDQTAGAIEKYAGISGSGVDDLPEYFLAAYVLMALGDVLTMTLETNSRKLWDWHIDIRQRWDRAVRKEEPAPREYNPTVGGRRADLVLFQGNHSKKTETDFLCLVEFKKWYLDAGDIKKIRDWFRFLDTCKYGMVCGFTEVPKYEAYLAQMEDTAIASGDKWVLGRIARPLGTIEDSQNFQTFAQIMENPNYRR